MSDELFPGHSMAGRVVAVSGGASGIGLATALRAARAGARVVVGDVRPDAVADAVGRAESLGLPVSGAPLDVRDPESVAAFVEGIDDLDGVVCAAGITRDSPVLDLPLAEWELVVGVNLTGTFLLAQAAARRMAAAGGGSLVLVSSSIAIRQQPNLAHYSASKAGILALARTMAEELGPRGVRVNAVCPGSTDTPMLQARRTPEQIAARAAQVPMRRVGEPDDLAAAICYFLSDASSWVTGQTLHVNGGSHMA